MVIACVSRIQQSSAFGFVRAHRWLAGHGAQSYGVTHQRDDEIGRRGAHDAGDDKRDGGAAAHPEVGGEEREEQIGRHDLDNHETQDHPTKRPR